MTRRAAIAEVSALNGLPLTSLRLRYQELYGEPTKLTDCAKLRKLIAAKMVPEAATVEARPTKAKKAPAKGAAKPAKKAPAKAAPKKPVAKPERAKIVHYADGTGAALCGARRSPSSDPKAVTCRNCLARLERAGRALAELPAKVKPPASPKPLGAAKAKAAPKRQATDRACARAAAIKPAPGEEPPATPSLAAEVAEEFAAAQGTTGEPPPDALAGVAVREEAQQEEGRRLALDELTGAVEHDHGAVCAACEPAMPGEVEPNAEEITAIVGDAERIPQPDEPVDMPEPAPVTDAFLPDDPPAAPPAKPVRPPRAMNPPKQPKPFAHDPRVPPAGTILTHKLASGEVVEAIVRETGYEWRGKLYRSLSAIANESSGQKWSGFVFFGLEKHGGVKGPQGPRKATVDKLAAEWTEAWNTMVRTDAIEPLPSLLNGYDQGKARQVAADARQLAQELADHARTLLAGAKMIEAKHGRAQA